MFKFKKKGIEPLALLVRDHADPAGRGGGLVEEISDEEPTVRQISGSALDSQLMEGITYTEV